MLARFLLSIAVVSLIWDPLTMGSHWHVNENLKSREIHNNHNTRITRALIMQISIESIILILWINICDIVHTCQYTDVVLSE